MNDAAEEKNQIDTETFTDIAERSQRLVSDFLSRHSGELNAASLDANHIGEAFMEMTAKMMTDPAKIIEAQVGLWQDYMNLWQQTANRMMGVESSPVIEPDKADRRFKDPAWSEHAVFDFLKQSYLLTSRCMETMVKDVEGLDDKTAQKVEFYTRQLVDAMSPSNFAFANPEVLRETAETNGENLVKGLQNLLEDLERGDGQLRISMTDEEAFEVGGNIAVTPGQVVFRNDLIELIQYTPTTEKVAKRPLLIVPPWINKFYILDLKPENSFIKWAVDQGHTVFVISWINPGSELRDKNFEDYMLEGPLAAIEAIEQATGEKSVNAIGYCIGGTLLGATLAYIEAEKSKKWKGRVASATYFTTMLDFAEAGELGVFIDEQQVSDLEAKMNERGFLEGREMAQTFNMMRANDLIWSFVINNYLLGKEPFPFDLLYWNGDSTRMPCAMHSFYLRKMYIENKLKDPGGIELAGVPIDLGKIKTPTYMVSTREDHIAPWLSTYRGTQMFSGPVRFVLAASGHIAGVVNPPAKKKYCYWTNAKNNADPEAWLEGAKQHEGSWWPDWDKWVKKHSDGEVDAREPGKGGKLKALAPAPGTYVLAKA
ncbi:MAG: class I poly(R)-hydroxyalkanoic acid synthase [Rhodospirillales bacterium]